MNVTSIGHGSGSVVTLPRPQTDGDVQTRSSSGSPEPTAARPRSEASQSDAAFARIAWFDVNGDGRIDGRSSFDGGDGILLLPRHAVNLPTFSRTVHAPVGRHEDDDQDTASAPTNEVQTRQAISAYQRYGQPSDSAPTDRAVA